MERRPQESKDQTTPKTTGTKTAAEQFIEKKLDKTSGITGMSKTRLA